MKTDLVGQIGFAVIVQGPTTARPTSEMAMSVLLARALPHDAACIAMLLPEACIDAVLGIQRRNDDVGYVRVALGMIGFAGQRETELPELRRQGRVQDRLLSGFGHVVLLHGFAG